MTPFSFGHLQLMQHDNVPRVNHLPQLLQEIGYREVSVERYDTSRIVDWNALGLDRTGSQREYKPESLYVEAVR